MAVSQNEESKTVMFQEKTELMDRNDEASKQEDRWYTSNEYFFMRRKATNMAKRMDEVDNTDEDCSRGLDIVEPNNVQERHEKIQTLVKAVMEKQKEDASPETIAQLCRKASQDSIEDSIRLAKCDAKDAKKILADIRKEWCGEKETKLSAKIKHLFRRKKN
ncbi:MAG: hypothetical protein SGBAC_011757 [Bacillariaceae sp.]